MHGLLLHSTYVTSKWSFGACSFMYVNCVWSWKSEAYKAVKLCNPSDITHATVNGNFICTERVWNKAKWLNQTSSNNMPMTLRHYPWPRWPRPHLSPTVTEPPPLYVPAKERNVVENINIVSQIRARVTLKSIIRTSSSIVGQRLTNWNHLPSAALIVNLGDWVSGYRCVAN